MVRPYVANMRTRLPGDVYIGRGSVFGNPFVMNDKSDEERTRVIAEYKTYFLDRVEKDSQFREEVLALKGRSLVCYCAPKPCHGDVILEWLESYDT